jgi:nucleotide-binding universal stress UspA family protein
MHSGPVIIGFDGSPASERALRDAAELLGPRDALVVVVWEAGRAYELAELPIRVLEVPPAAIDVRTAMEVDQAMYEAAERMAQRGAALANELGFKADGIAVADDITVAQTLIRLARENDATALVVGAHGHGALRELVLGSTTREVLQDAPCPVVVVRH